MTYISVIIPYFQTEPDVLKTALASVFAQQVRPEWVVEVLIVDDGSPSPAELSLDQQPPEGMHVRVVKRPNGGPGAARNTGLEEVGRLTNYVAYLDSDDRWTADHLVRAIETLRDDADFYFSDQGMGELSPYDTHFAEVCAEHGSVAFQQSGLPAGIVASDPRNPIIVPRGPDGSYLFRHEHALTALLRSFLPHISCTVIRAATVGNIRFSTDLRTAGEDYLYFLTLANLARQTCYSMHVGVQRGRGVSIYYESFSWNTPRSLNSTLDNYVCLLLAKRTLRLNLDQAQILAQRVAFRRLELTARIAAELKRWRFPARDIWRAILRYDPMFILVFPLLAIRVLQRLLVGRPIADRARGTEIG
jgi:succinoglycan biosynthesis protein ExoW